MHLSIYCVVWLKQCWEIEVHCQKFEQSSVTDGKILFLILEVKSGSQGERHNCGLGSYLMSSTRKWNILEVGHVIVL